MGKFYTTDGNHLISVGECQDGLEGMQALPGHTAHSGEPPPDLRPRGTPPPRYDKLRGMNYPEVGDQLDAIWKVIGPAAPDGSEARAMYDKILAVKTKYPKP